mgnify:CR=1 FL=1
MENWQAIIATVTFLAVIFLVMTPNFFSNFSEIRYPSDGITINNIGNLCNTSLPSLNISDKLSNIHKGRESELAIELPI